MDGLKLYLQALGNSDIPEQYYTCGLIIFMWLPFFAFVLMEQFQLHFDPCMIIRLWSWVRFIGHWRRCMKKIGKCCVDLVFGNIDQQYLYKSCQDLLGSSASTQAERKMELWKKNQGDISKANGRWVGDVDNAGLSWGYGIGLFTKSMVNEWFIKNVCLTLEFAGKDGRDSGLIRLEIHTCHTFNKMPMKMYSFNTWAWARSHWKEGRGGL